ncbi:ABC transporter ATP-binding protein [Candidatus Poriferisocius sp.]|uniref:ABC transporter ATP-binding protein n=1 Tax=Candidatus Poriferisocius sp. TaxID=3101276 RepID=UPI003B5A8C2E
MKTYRGATEPAVKGIDVEVPDGELVTLLGPSGCGKTTTLRCIAGLESPDEGRIRIGGRTVFSSEERIRVPTNRRNTGMVFQSYAIWPHMTVLENVAYPLRVGRISKSEVRQRVNDALDLVGLSELADRPAPNLSGGQQQRVALARALVSEPEVLLFDEPLSNLDAQLRESMRQEIREVQQRLGIAALYVTHDQTEALAISDQVIVMSDGEILDIGPPQRIYERPSSHFVAEFIGLANIFEVADVKEDGGLMTARCDLGTIRFPRDPGALSSDEVSVLVRLEDVSLEAPGPSSENRWPGRIISALFLGTLWDCFVDVDGVRVRAHVPRTAQPKAGDAVTVCIRPEDCVTLLR